MQSDHPLARPMRHMASGYPIVETIGLYLEALYQGKLYETLAAGYPGKEIIFNLTHAYADIAPMIFWDQGNEHDYTEALRAFPLFVDDVLETELGLDELYNVYRIVDDFTDGEPTAGDGPAHHAGLWSTVRKLSGVFEEEAYKEAIYGALKDKSRSDYFELISMAAGHYGEDGFELLFGFARHSPKRLLESSHWFFDLDGSQQARFISWARSLLPSEGLGEPIARTRTFSEAEAAVLKFLLSYVPHMLSNEEDRRDFIVWGLSSSEKHLASDAAWLLEDVPPAQWPKGSIEIIGELYEQMEPNWTSWKKKERKYVQAKDRLGDLLQRAQD